MINCRGAMCLLMFLQAFLAIGSSATAGDKPKLRKASGIGSAYGFILDASTHQYLTGASVTLAVPADMEPIKNSHATTNENGYFEIKAPLGESHTHSATERLADLSIASILGGGAKQVDRILTASCLNFTISKAGYKTFYGTVPVYDPDAAKFRVNMSPVFLMPETQSYVSHTNPHYMLGKIDTVELSSRFVVPDEVINFTVKVSGVPLRPNGKISLECLGSKGGHKEIVERKPHSDIIYRSEYRIDKHSYAKPGFYVISWSLQDSDYTSVSCDMKNTIFVVGCEAGKQQEVTQLLRAYERDGAGPALNTFSERNNPTAKPLPYSEELISRAAMLMPAGSDFSSIKAYLSPITKKVEPQNDGEFGKTIANLREETGDAKKNKAAQIEIANLYYSHGDYDLARANYDILFQSPNVEKIKNFYLFHNYAALLLRQGNYQEADKYFALALNNAHANVHDNSAPTSQIYFGTDSYTLYSGAKNTSVNGFAYQEAVSDELIVGNESARVPTESNWLYSTILGKAMNDIGLTNNSFTLLKQVAHLEPNEPQVLFALAATETSAKQYADALETVRHGLSFDPSNEEATALEKHLILENSLISKSIHASPVRVKHFVPRHKVKS